MKKLESFALLQRRLGLAAAGKFGDSCQGFLIEWIDRVLHQEATRELIHARRRAISLVDQLSFLVMRKHSVVTAFAFDQDFVRAGFRLVQ